MPPDDDALLRADIVPTVLAGLVDVAERSGLDPSPWFAGTGLHLTHVLADPDARVSYRQVATVLRRAVRALPGRPLGMQVGARDVLLSFGVLGLALRSSRTLREAVATTVELHRAAGSLVDVEVEGVGGGPDAVLVVRLRERWPDAELAPFLCEEALASAVLLVRSVLGAEWHPAFIELAYPPPPYADDYARLLGVRVRFGAAAHRLGLAVADLDRPLPTGNVATRAVAVEACRRLLQIDAATHDLVAAVESLLGHDLRRSPTMAEVAQRLHVTERTLRRHLTDAGVRFSDVRDRVRERRATLLLRESRLPVATVADEVGFSDGREFRRAYRRWTGRTPTEARDDAGPRR